MAMLERRHRKIAPRREDAPAWSGGKPARTLRPCRLRAARSRFQRSAQSRIEDAMDWLRPGAADTPDSGMGHFNVSVQVSHRAGGRFEPLEALVDTGATYTWIPRDVLEGLGIVPEDQWPFVLADGREVLYPVAWINIRMRDRVQPTIVVFGEPGSGLLETVRLAPQERWKDALRRVYGSALE